MVEGSGLDQVRAQLDAEAHEHELPPREAYDDEPLANGHERALVSPAGGFNPQPPRSPPLDWRTLEKQTPPERQWAIEHWLGMGHVTLISGSGGTGKTNIAQAVGSCLTLRREYLDWIPAERRVLFWACEDDVSELWRRQIAIAKWLSVPLSAFADRLMIHSYDGCEVALAGLSDQRLTGTPMLAELREQIGDYKADVVLLDNLARLYAGSENDRHQVTTFISLLTAAAAPTKAAVLLLGHPGKAAGSEYSGSTAWEGSVRARLYLSRTLPDAQRDQDGEPAEDDGVRYLSRRKANYSARDWRRLQFLNGVMVPDPPPEANAAGPRAGDEYACDVVARAVRKLSEMGEHGVAASNSPKYLPRLAREYKLLDRLSEKQFASTMRTMRTSGQLVMKQVGLYANRTPREALALPEGQP
jgi:archaellum biogenesis ATPase FlaH